ncbi:nitroreductase [Acetobacter lambici]|uniref:Putative NAD(P)H nitroreductase n=1 Tax=Acetobacter lambici TaxID=1332824 RepID=A0ABT1EYF1_9PROT|nr:nitroreductase [Acetobacter lambici]MCP1241830.1 nitroreductase [Acetobacter lambici]MCP1257972.1 nitroreductase [Acetobacter lambici]NHO56332.1 nitroreductase [Acetobacter lambici]
MTPMDMLLSRASTDRLQTPAPAPEQLMVILATAMRAPDHGRVQPWRYVVIEGADRPALAERIVASMARVEPDAPAAKIEKRRSRFATMPMIIALGMHLHPAHKIPLWEQEMCVAAGAMNILNALHATGFGGVWVSGALVDDAVLAADLGVTRLAGFLFVGTPEGTPHTPKRADPALFTARWHGQPVTFGADKD